MLEAAETGPPTSSSRPASVLERFVNVPQVSNSVIHYLRSQMSRISGGFFLFFSTWILLGVSLLLLDMPKMFMQKSPCSQAPQPSLYPKMILSPPDSLHRTMGLSGTRKWQRRLHKDAGRRQPPPHVVHESLGPHLCPIPLAGDSSCSVFQ